LIQVTTSKNSLLNQISSSNFRPRTSESPI